MSLYILCVVSAICMAVDGLCPSGWTLFGDSCYDVVKDKEEWAEANYLCEIHQGYMAVIESSAENDFVKGLIKTEGVTEDVWIGADDLWEEGVFRWAATNQELNFTDWKAGEPNNIHNNENCVEIEYYLQDQWNDDMCTKKQSFICETSPSSRIVG
ncbi:C-type lectin lectoxin-Lio2-like [Haliotis rubra]|uniref:C-type lectin lectoxin-Lio2-like n=1 Tax=Haliotis rubra TaxID=36100 RepID=UPI001EE57786|nr:C-type lectin lectoxin-Lio2-like [Haliotis rubra]